MFSGHQFHAQTIKECLMDMRRARYSVRDFQYIYDISEKNFEIPIYLRLDIRQSLSEVVNASLVDLQKSQIEISRTEVHQGVP